MSDEPDTVNTNRYDLCILGAGPAGYAAAMRAHDFGKRVALVEAGELGGAGLHNGALSSKAMWHLANDYARACKEGRGFQSEVVEANYEAVMKSVAQAVEERRSLLAEQLDQLATSGIDLFRGRGRFLSANEVAIARESGGDLRIEADHILIATGSTPRVPKGIDVDGDRIVTSDHIESWKDFPESLIIIGSGVIGCEYATIFGHYGRTRIFMLDRRERILPFEDEDVAAFVAHSFEKMGVVIHSKAQLKSMVRAEGKVRYEIESDGVTSQHEVERALISIGRQPRIANLDLDKAGVNVTERGGIQCEGVRTNVPHIFAAGDVSMDIALANVAELEGRRAVECMFGGEPPALSFDSLSTIMFLEPEVASVGLGEQEARKRGLAHSVAAIDNRNITRNIAMRNTRGFIKLIAAPDRKILGLRVVGPQASSCIQGMALLIRLGGTLDDIANCVHPHPAITEGVQECARLLLSQSLLKEPHLRGVRVDHYTP